MQIQALEARDQPTSPPLPPTLRRTGSHRSAPSPLALLICLAWAPAQAANCNVGGGLGYVGTTASQNRTVWLSGTGPGSFMLEAAQGGQVVDRWDKSRRGLHLSLSPVVSSGNGGVHKLYELGSKNPCLLDSKNQKGGIALPPLASLPNRLPPWLRPPGTGGGDGGSTPIPPIGMRPPGSVSPGTPSLPNAPIGTLPPTGLMPTVPSLPGALPSSPIATLPPTGLTPTVPSLPGALPSAPIATLPPTGLTPTVPSLPGALPSAPIATLPPTGLTPTVPSLPGALPSAPIATLPPTGLTPTVPSVPGALPSAPIATLPPTGLTPTVPSVPGALPSAPIATLPPTGLTPTVPSLPGALPSAPIATLPPTGLTPTVPSVPGALPSAPIATLPPTGLTPTVPSVPGALPSAPIASLPPTGLTPTVPSLPGALPSAPIATLPPTGLTPTVPSLPGALPSAPIATLPPTGLTPTVPSVPGALPSAPIASLPPTGLTPTVPSLPGALPSAPIATLPPTGLTPTVPSLPGVPPTPPVGTLPPTALTPTLPSTPTLEPPMGAPALRSSALAAAAAGRSCVQDAERREPQLGSQAPDADCPQPRASELQAAAGAAITPQRQQLPEGADWNAWADSRGTLLSDRRNGLDLDSHGAFLVIGADRHLSGDLVGGLSFTADYNRMRGFNDDWVIASRGLSLGPYLGYRLNASWSLSAALGFARSDNEQRILTLRGNFVSRRVDASLGLLGTFTDGDTQWLPSLSLNLARTHNRAYALQGQIESLPVTVQMPSNSSGSGSLSGALQWLRSYQLTDGGKFMPYAELGLRHDFLRPGGGAILTADLQSVPSTPWSGSLRLGFKSQLLPTTVVELGLGYLSLGQRKLDVVETRFYLSHAF